MYQNYPNYFQNQQPTPLRPPGLKGRPVSSLDEVRGTTIDFDGSVFFFPDLANKRIYTKQINMDGTASLNVYELKNVPLFNETNVENFITREEFTNAMNQVQTALEQLTTPKATNSIAAQF